MANHWRDFSELIFFIDGSAKIVLEQIDTQERVEYNLEKGSFLFIPPRIGFKLTSKIGSKFISCLEREFVSDDVKKHKYKVK